MNNLYQNAMANGPQIELPPALYSDIVQAARKKRTSISKYLASLVEADTRTIRQLSGLLDAIQGQDIEYLDNLIEIDPQQLPQVDRRVKVAHWYISPLASRGLGPLEREQVLSRVISGDTGAISPKSSNPEYANRYRLNQQALAAGEGLVVGRYAINDLAISCLARLQKQSREALNYDTSLGIVCLSSEL